MNTAETVLRGLSQRYATKEFDPKRRISEAEWQVLECALHLCPSGYGLQPWKFLVIRDPKIKKELMLASLNQKQVEESSHFIVFTSKIDVNEEYIDSHISVVAQARKLPRENFRPYFQMMVDDVIHGPKSKYVSEWAARQTYIALGTLLTSAAILGIDSCPLEGIIPEKYDEILGLKGSGYRTLLGCALGYRTSTDKYATFAKARFNKEQIIKYV